MARIHLIVGPVGSGKSTFAKRLCHQHGAVRLNLDEWMAGLFAQDRPESGVMPWYVERSERCVTQILLVAERIIEAGTDVVLEVGLIRGPDRQKMYDRVEASGLELTIYVLDAPRELRRERVERRNLERGETFSMVVPPDIFELASDLWQPLSPAECATHDVRFVGDSTDGVDP